MADRRTAYNRARYAEQKKRNEQLETFKRLYPERYAQLVEQAKSEPIPQKIEVVRHTLTPTVDVASIPDILRYKTTPYGKIPRKWPLSPEELDEILYDPNEVDVYVWFKDAYGKETMTFKGVTKNLENVEAQLIAQIPGAVSITKYAICKCPACLRRFPLADRPTQ